MDITLVRFSSGVESTLGLLFVNGRFFCYTLEDQYNEVKVPGETCIPPGSYEIQLREEGGMYPRYKSRFSPWHRGMLWLQDVPGFEYIYIHVGNKDDDSEGCILVGDGQVSNSILVGDGQVTSSVSAYKRLYEEILDAMEFNETVTIEVIEGEY